MLNINQFSTPNMAVGLAICQILKQEYGVTLDNNARLVTNDGAPHSALDEKGRPACSFHISACGPNSPYAWTWWSGSSTQLDPHFESVADFRKKLPGLMAVRMKLNDLLSAVVHRTTIHVEGGDTASQVIAHQAVRDLCQKIRDYKLQLAGLAVPDNDPYAKYPEEARSFSVEDHKLGLVLCLLLKERFGVPLDTNATLIQGGEMREWHINGHAFTSSRYEGFPEYDWKGTRGLVLQRFNQGRLPLHFATLSKFVDWLSKHDVPNDVRNGKGDRNRVLRLNEYYEAVISESGNTVKVGCQTFDVDNVLALGEKLDELHPLAADAA